MLTLQNDFVSQSLSGPRQYLADEMAFGRGPTMILAKTRDQPTGSGDQLWFDDALFRFGSA